MKRYAATVVALAILVAFAVSNFLKQTPKTDFDLNLLGETPVHMNGRIQPLDSVARNAMLAMQGKRTAKYEDGTRHLSIEWLADLMFAPERADARPVFKIFDETIRSLLPAKEEEAPKSALVALLKGRDSHFYYSLNDIRPVFQRLHADAVAASKIDAKIRDRYQSAVVDLVSNVIQMHGLSSSIHHGKTESFAAELELLAGLLPRGTDAISRRERGEEYDEEAFRQMLTYGAIYQSFDAESVFLPLPRQLPDGSLTWEKMADTLSHIARDGQPSETARQYALAVDAYRADDAAAFNAALQGVHVALEAVSPEVFENSGAEFAFNYLEPFYIAEVSYVLAALLVLISWIRWPDSLNRAAFACALFAFFIHSVGIGFRIYILGYAPIINLYSSAIFVGWGSALLALILERIHRNGIGALVASLIGFATLLVADGLGKDGDTLEKMRAVLNSNFWLATHVPTVTFGYAATFIAGALGLVYILLGLLTKRIDKDAERTFASMVYGIVCFAALTSFVGTILGGIWADQSWGRFWGWDPKENGAILVVLWNVLILHARWGGFVKTRGLMMMAVFGNIVTSASWMGTNMLGIGLHSYGFMDAAFNYLMLFWASQLAIIALAAIPPQHWRSAAKG